MSARRPLTDRAIDKARPAAPGKRVMLWDALLPGLAVRITDKGRKSFVVMGRIRKAAGPPIRIYLGRYPLTSLAAARAAARDVLGLMDRGVDPRVVAADAARAMAEAEAQAERDSADTFSAVVAQFEALHLARLRRGHDVSRQIARELAPTWGRQNIRSIARRDVLDVLDRIERAGEPYRRNRLLATTRKLFNWCIGRGILEVNPAARIPMLREEPRDRVLADAELRRLWATWGQQGTFGDLCKFLLLTGQRRDEAARMTWADVDLAAPQWTIPAAGHKGGRAHLVPLAPAAVAIVKARRRAIGDGSPPADDDPVFVTERGNRVTAFSKHKASTDRIAGVTGWRLHDLRRTCASNLARAGVSRVVVEKVLGHAPSGVTGRHYDRHEYLMEKRRALDAWAKALGLIVHPRGAKVAALRKPRGSGAAPASGA